MNNASAAKLAHTGFKSEAKLAYHVWCFWTLATKVKYLGSLHIENTKKTASTQLCNDFVRLYSFELSVV